MHYRNIVLTKETIAKILDLDMDIEENGQLQQALESIELEEKYESMPSGLTAWGQPMSEFHKQVKKLTKKDVTTY